MRKAQQRQRLLRCCGWRRRCRRKRDFEGLGGRTMNAAARALAAARAAGVEVARRGHGLYVKSHTKPPTDILEALRRHKSTILELLDAERCAHCQRQGSTEKPLLECAYAGQPLLLHSNCIQGFMASRAAASPCYAPRVVCDY